MTRQEAHRLKVARKKNLRRLSVLQHEFVPTPGMGLLRQALRGDKESWRNYKALRKDGYVL